MILCWIDGETWREKAIGQERERGCDAWDGGASGERTVGSFFVGGLMRRDVRDDGDDVIGEIWSSRE